jgi:transcriptional regulator NrdR family protein
MRCINSDCNYPKTRISDSRSGLDGRSHIRRHKCVKCQTRYTTYELIFLKSKKINLTQEQKNWLNLMADVGYSKEPSYTIKEAYDILHDYFDFF